MTTPAAVTRKTRKLWGGCTYTHVHDETCGYTEGKDTAPCSVEAAHLHDTAVCGYVEEVQGAPCTHVHDEACGGLGSLEESGTSCMLTEGCGFPAGHEGECDVPEMLGAAPPNSSEISGDGYVFDPAQSKLTVTSNAGTTNWRADTRIASDDSTRYDAVQSVEFGSTITTIGYNAFWTCRNLTSVDLSGCTNLQSIEGNAFAVCSSLQNVSLPKSLRTLGNLVFGNCGSLSAITVAPDNPTFTSQDGVLYDKSMGTLLQYPRAKNGNAFTIPSTVTTIGENAFELCPDLTYVSFPAGLSSIGFNAFVSCDNLASMVFQGENPPSLTEYSLYKPKPNGTLYHPEGAESAYASGNFGTPVLDGWTRVSTDFTLTVAFDDNNTGGTSLNDNEMKTVVEAALNNSVIDKKNIVTIKLTGDADAITEYNWKYLLELFQENSGWTALTTLDLSGMSSLRKVETADPAASMPKLKTVSFPACLQTIGKNAFMNCGNLTGVDLTGCTSLQSIGDGAFGGCESLYQMDLSGCTALQRIEKGAFFDCARLASVNFPQSLQRIEERAFGGCASLSSVNLPKGLQSLGSTAFLYCASLTEITVTPGNTYFTSRDGVLYSESRDALLLYPMAKSGDSFTIPNTVKTIGNYAFYGCANLTGVSFPENLQSIGSVAFCGCKGLTDLNLSGCTGLQNIGDSTFGGCEGLKNVGFPQSLQSIGKQAFDNCKNLADVDLSGNTSLQNIGEQAFNSCANVNLSGCTSLQSIGKDIFSYSKSLTTVDLSGCTSLQSLGDSAFFNCKSLTAVDLSGCTGLESIESHAFRGCDRLQSMTFPQGLQSIGKSVFYYTNLTSMTFLGKTPPRVVEDSSFYGVNANGTLYHPASAVDDYASGVFGTTDLDNWARIPLYALTVAEGSDETGRALYVQGTKVQIKANAAPAGKVFDEWTGGDDSIFASGSRTSADTTITMPAKDVTVTATYKNLANSLTIQAGTGGKIIQGINGSYAAGTDIPIEARANTNYAFDGWTTSDGGTFADKDSASTTFKMPDNATTITANFRYTGSYTPVPDEPSYTDQTLTDKASGVSVRGSFTDDAVLEIKETLQHAEGECDVCDDIRARQDKGELIVFFDISLLSGSYTGDLIVEIPVGEEYNGQTVIMMHCKDKTVESRTLTVENGVARGTFSSFSPFAVVETPKAGSIKLTPSRLTMELGESGQIQAVVSPADTYNKKVDWKSSNRKIAVVSDSGQVKAIKAGAATITCTAADGSGVKDTCKVMVRNTDTPILIAKATAGKNSVRLNWNQISNADGYEIYGSRCGKNYSYKKIKTITKGSTKTWTQKKLKTATAYKYYIKAYKLVNGRKLYLRVSKTCHTFTTGGKYTNVKAVTATFTDITLSKGKTRQISARVTPVKKGGKLANHVPKFRYKTTNSKVATVTASGKIKAAGKGKCSVYVYANNGVTRRIMITVK